MSTFVESALQRVRSKLLDLTRRNRLLNYKESVRSIRVVDELPDEVFRILAIDGKEMEFLPLSEEVVGGQKALISESLEKSSNDLELPLPSPQIAKKHKDTRLQTPFSDRVLERRCKKLFQESKTAIEETGSNLLYLAMGFLEWYEDDNSSELTRAPLFLVPVMIEKTRVNRNTNCYSYVISYTGEDIETNLSLAEKLNCGYDLILPTLEDEFLPEQYFKEVSRTVAKMKRWRVAREMVLGLFSFSKLLMFKDLDNDQWPDHAKLIENINIGRIIGGRQAGDIDEYRIYGEEYDIDHDPRVTQIPLILDADSSQTSVIIDTIINRESLVVEGPPGTGKSQTIANLIAAALSSGLSVLFVAEKKAALEVVRSRLNHSGLGDFCLELHSHKTQKGQLHADINKRLSKTYRDSRDLDQEIGDMVRERDRLLEYSNLVNSVVGPNGETIYDIFWIVEKSLNDISGNKLQFRVSNALQLNRQQINDRIHTLQDVARLISELPEEAISAWQGFYPKSYIPGDDGSVSCILSTFFKQVDGYLGFLARRNVANIEPLTLNLADLRRLSITNKEILLHKPPEYIESLASKFSIKINIQILKELDSKVHEFKQLMNGTAVIEKSFVGELTKDMVLPISEAANRLATVGYGNSTPNKILEFEDYLDKTIKVMQRFVDTANSARECLYKPSGRLTDFERIVSLAEFRNLSFSHKEILLHKPPEYIGSLAPKLSIQINVQTLKELDSKIYEFKQQMNGTAVIEKCFEGELNRDKVLPIAEATNRLITLGYKDRTPIKLQEFFDYLDKTIKIMQRLVEAANSVRECVSKPSERLTDFESLVNLVGFRRLSLSKKDILHQKPPEYIDSLAPKFSSHTNIQTLNELDSQIHEFRQLMNDSEVIEKCIEGKLTKEKVLPIAEAAGRLETLGHGDSTPKKLHEFGDYLDKTIRIMQRLEEAANTVRVCFYKFPEKLIDYDKIINLNKLLEVAPTDFFAHRHPKYVLESTSQKSAMVFNQCNALLKRKKELEEIFLIRYLPDHDQIIDIARNLRGFRGSFFSVFSGKYWEVRRALKGFLVNVKIINAPSLIESLESLADTLKSIKDLKSNEAYKQSLGPFYDGLETNWQKLDEYLKWGHEFSCAVGSETHAHSIVMQSLEMKSVISVASKTVEEAVAELTKTFEILKIDENKVMQFVKEELVNRKENLRLPLNQLLSQGFAQIEISSINSAAQSFLSAVKLQENLDGSKYSALLGDFYQKMGTDTENILKTVRWISDLSELGNIPKSLVNWVVADTDTRRSLVFNLLKFNEDNIAKLVTAFENLKIDENREILFVIEDLTKRKEQLEIPLKQLQLQGFAQIDITSINSASQSFLSACHIQENLDSNKYFALLGDYYQKMGTDTGNILKTVRWISDLSELGDIPINLVSWIVAADTDTRRSLVFELLNLNENSIVELTKAFKILKIAESREILFVIEDLITLKEPLGICVKILAESLDNLADTLKFIDNLKSKETYKQTLGPLYDGLETNWQKLDEYLTWRHKYLCAADTESHAHSIITQTFEMKPVIAGSSKTVEKAVAELATALEILKIDEIKEMQFVKEDLANRKEYLRLPLKQLTLEGLAEIDITTINTAAQSFLSASKLQSSLDGNKYSALLGDYYQRMDTGTENILKTAHWVLDLIISGNIPTELVEWIVAADTDTRRSLVYELLEVNADFIEQCDCLQIEMVKYGEFLPVHYFGTDVTGVTLTEVRNAVTSCLDNIRYLAAWNDYQNTVKESHSLGLQDITESITSERINPEESGALYRHAVYESMVREIVGRHSVLSSFTRTSFEGVRKRFATLDRQIMISFRERIAHKTSSRPIPVGVGYGPVKEHTDRHLLDRELQKKKRHIPIRQLVRRAGKALQAIKPCFMMSPMSVAQYLEPGNITFDLVVMDEASQLRPEDALGSIARAQQLIVVGDPNQLPPTNFFDKVDGISEENDEIAAIQDTESILDICMTTYQKRRLRWHYRSEHESLIAFSNHQFYDDNLIIFPSPKGKNRNYGLHRHYIDGATYVKGLNRIEAEAVAIAVIEHFRSHSNLTLGVATFNREQADLMQDVLERMQKEHPWLERKIRETDLTEEPFFVKNLENVQGDERDVIFVSTTYGPDPTTGKVHQRFGPIAGDTGWRRLNVIFTRAKKRLELFTSLRSSDIRLNDKPTKGSQSFKAYLEYAETGLLADYGSIGSREPDSDFEVSVSKHLGLHGFKTVAQVGVAGFFIDIGVLHPGRDGEFILGIECDGAAYHSSKSARDRDRLRQEILEHKGWKIHRIWSTDWFKNRDNEIARMLKVVRDAEIAEEYGISNKTDEHIGIDVQLAEFISKMKSETPVEELPKTQQANGKVSGLREELLEYRKTNILANCPDVEKCLLRDDMLNFLIRFRPTSLDEFHQAVPASVRQNTDAKQMQFINDVFEIIEGYV
jgi:very-short-patch-repair endonuclease